MVAIQFTLLIKLPPRAAPLEIPCPSTASTTCLSCADGKTLTSLSMRRAVLTREKFMKLERK